MKLHVPANFIGYGTCAGRHGGICLPDQATGDRDPLAQATPLWLLGIVLCFLPLVFRKSSSGGRFLLIGYLVVSAVIVGSILMGRC